MCGPPAIPANSRVTTKAADYGIGEAKYECDTGYELFGSDTVRCDAKKGWDKEMPFCGELRAGPRLVQVLILTLSIWYMSKRCKVLVDFNVKRRKKKQQSLAREWRREPVYEWFAKHT